jgi:hypothetical protein
METLPAAERALVHGEQPEELAGEKVSARQREHWPWGMKMRLERSMK